MAERSVSVFPGSSGAMNPMVSIIDVSSRVRRSPSPQGALSGREETSLVRVICAVTTLAASAARVVTASFWEHMSKVRVHRMRRDVEASRHVSVRESLGDEFGHRSFARGQAVPPLLRALAGASGAAADAEGPQ